LKKITQTAYLALAIASFGSHLGCTEWFGHRTTPEFQVVRYLNALHTTQRDFFSRSHRFGTLPETARVIEDQLPGYTVKATHDNYELNLELRSTGYSLRAIPKPHGTGRRSFFIDETGIVRQSWGPEPASSVSEVLK